MGGVHRDFQFSHQSCLFLLLRFQCQEQCARLLINRAGVGTLGQKAFVSLLIDFRLPHAHPQRCEVGACQQPVAPQPLPRYPVALLVEDRVADAEADHPKFLLEDGQREPRLIGRKRAHDCDFLPGFHAGMECDQFAFEPSGTRSIGGGVG
jgi:hypothetical protein